MTFLPACWGTDSTDVEKTCKNRWNLGHAEETKTATTSTDLHCCWNSTIFSEKCMRSPTWMAPVHYSAQNFPSGVFSGSFHDISCRQKGWIAWIFEVAADTQCGNPTINDLSFARKKWIELDRHKFRSVHQSLIWGLLIGFMQLTNVYHTFSILSLHDFTLWTLCSVWKDQTFFIDPLRKPALSRFQMGRTTSKNIVTIVI